MPELCKLWVNLASAGPRAHPHGEPTTYLQFPATGLLVGLPDEPGMLVEPDVPAGRFVMREEDADGLGLSREDLAAGVALCRTDGSPFDWRCEPVDLVINGEAEVRTPHWHELATISSAGTWLRGGTVAPPSRSARGRPRLLVWVTPDQLFDGTLERAAREARTRDALVVLAAVGEVPETARHAAEERAALAAMLDQAATFFAELVEGTCMEFGGDPVHGLLTLAVEAQASAILVPGDEHRHALFERAIARELEERGHLPVLRALAAPAAARSEVTGTTLVTEEVPARVVVLASPAFHDVALSIEGFDSESIPDDPETWRSMIRDASAAGPHPPAPFEAACDLSASWRVRRGSCAGVERLPLALLIDALRAAHYVPRDPSWLRAVGVELVPFDGEERERVEVTVRWS